MKTVVSRQPRHAKLQVQMRFARVEVVYDELVDVPPKPSRREAEEIRARLVAAMHELQREADNRSGFRDPLALSAQG